MKRPATDPATKAEALRLAGEVGAAEASRQTGVPAATIRAWRSRGDSRPAITAAAPSPVTEGLDEFETRLLARAKNAVELGVARLEQLIPTAKGVQSIAISSGILIDKIRQLDLTIAEAQERRTRIAEADAQVMVRMFTAYFTALGLPETPAMRKTWAECLRQVAVFREDGDGVTRSVQPPEAGQARADLERHMRAQWVAGIRSEIRAELEAEMEAERLARPALPAPPVEPVEPTPMPEPEAESDDDDTEVVSGEVVDEPGPWTGPQVQVFYGANGGPPARVERSGPAPRRI